MTAKYINVLVDSRTVAIGTPGGNLSLKIKSRAQQITLKTFKDKEQSPSNNFKNFLVLKLFAGLCSLSLN